MTDIPDIQIIKQAPAHRWGCFITSMIFAVLAHSLPQASIWFLPLWILAIMAFWMFATTFFNKWWIADECLYYETGLFTKCGFFTLTQIQRVHVHYGMFGQTSDIGDVRLELSGGAVFSIKHIEHPNILADAINSYLEESYNKTTPRREYV